MEFKDTVFARRSNRFLLEKPLKKEEIDYMMLNYLLSLAIHL